METASRRRQAAISPYSVGGLSTTAADEHYRYPYCSPKDELEFAPLLPQRRRSAVTERRRPRTGCTGAQAALSQPQAPSAQREPRRRAPPSAKARRVRWHEMAFGSVRVPAAMDMAEIRRRLRAPRSGADDEPAGWAPWGLIRSLSCKGVEAVAVAAA